MSTPEAKGVAAVVGVGAGLGAALARRFARHYAVALMARDEGKLEQLASEISAAGGRAIAVSVDVSKAEEIQSAFARTRKELGDVDVLLYNAAMRPFGRLMETKPSTFETTWRVNAFGAFLCSREVVPAMLSNTTRPRSSVGISSTESSRTTNSNPRHARSPNGSPAGPRWRARPASGSCERYLDGGVRGADTVVEEVAPPLFQSEDMRAGVAAVLEHGARRFRDKVTFRGR